MTRLEENGKYSNALITHLCPSIHEMVTRVLLGNPSESPGGSVRGGTPEGYRELRDFKLDIDNSDSEGEDVLAALTAYTDYDTSFVIALSTVRYMFTDVFLRKLIVTSI